MLIKDLNITEDTEHHHVMVQRKSNRAAMEFLAPYSKKKWFENIEDATSNPEEIGVYSKIAKSVAVDPSMPNAKIYFDSIWISTAPTAQLSYEIVNIRGEEYLKFASAISKLNYSFFKTPQMLAWTKDALAGTGLFDDNDLQGIYIIGANSSFIRVSLPTMKAALRDIAEKYKKLKNYMLDNYLTDYDAVGFALNNIKRYQSRS